MQVWIGLWSGLCFVSTLMTLTTFLIDTERFKYPERPIVFLSACYFMVSVGYLVRVVLGHEEVACQEGMIRYSSTGPVACTMVFLLVYFFGMASSIWYDILCNIINTLQKNHIDYVREYKVCLCLNSC